MEVIDSCATNNGGCDHDCKHGVGGPICSCHKGYMLQADARTCEGEFDKLSHLILWCWVHTRIFSVILSGSSHKKCLII